MSNLTKISSNLLARKCSSYDWSNGPIRLQYMPTLWSDFSSIQYYQKEWAYGTKTNLGILFQWIIHLPLTARPNALLPNSYAHTFIHTRTILPCLIFGPCSSVRVPLSPDRGLTLIYQQRSTRSTQNQYRMSSTVHSGINSLFPSQINIWSWIF